VYTTTLTIQVVFFKNAPFITKLLLFNKHFLSFIIKVPSKLFINASGAYEENLYSLRLS
jgi:hypothetical protein